MFPIVDAGCASVVARSHVPVNTGIPTRLNLGPAILSRPSFRTSGFHSVPRNTVGFMSQVATVPIRYIIYTLRLVSEACEAGQNKYIHNVSPLRSPYKFAAPTHSLATAAELLTGEGTGPGCRRS